MTTNRISTGQEFEWQQRRYKVIRLLPDNKVNIEDIHTSAISLVTQSDLLNAFSHAELSFKDRGHDAVRSSVVNGKPLSLDDYPANWVETAKWRFQVIEPLLSRERSRADVKRRVDEIGKIFPSRETSVASVYRWIKRYESSDGDFLSLIPDSGNSGGKGELRIGAIVNTVIENTINDMLFTRERITAHAIWLEVCRRIDEENKYRQVDDLLKFPSYKTVLRRIQAVEIYKKTIGTRGKRTANKLFQQYNESNHPDTPLERVEIDHTVADIIVVDDEGLVLGRPTLTFCIDAATRYPLGYYLSFEPPSSYAVMECLYHAILPKNAKEEYKTENEWLAYGVPAKLVTDHGKEFMALAESCALLGIELEHNTPRTPEMKAIIERMFSTLNTSLFHTIPGTTFSNPGQRDSKDYDSAKQATLTLRELEEVLVITLIDYYAQSPHRGLGTTPANAWQAAMDSGFSPRLPADASTLHILLGCTIQRTIQHYGIEFEGLRYNTPTLGILRAKLLEDKSQKSFRRSPPVKMKYHPGNISRIWVLDPYDMEYIEVVALAQEYTHNLSLWQHRVIRKEARYEQQDTVDIAALGRAKKRIQDLVDNSQKKKRSATSSKAVARWDSKKELEANTSEDINSNDYSVAPEFVTNYIENFAEELDVEPNALPRSRRNSA